MKLQFIKAKLLLGGISLVLAPLVVVGLIAITKTTDALLTQGKNGARETAFSIVKNLDNIIAKETNIANTHRFRSRTDCLCRLPRPAATSY